MPDTDDKLQSTADEGDSKPQPLYDPGEILPLSQLEDTATGERPSYNWWTIIRAAIIEAPEQRMTLNEIYDAVAQHFVFFRTEADTWRNAIRHNLSVKPCFKRDKRDTDPAKAGYWAVDVTVDPAQGRVRVRKKCGRLHSAVTQLKCSLGRTGTQRSQQHKSRLRQSRPSSLKPKRARRIEPNKLPAFSSLETPSAACQSWKRHSP